MGLGPINSIYHARFNKYLHHRRIDDTSASRVWCFVGDGECDEPETLAGLALAGREQLDNLTWVVNCNLQRLDGPVRGNGKVIQELEATFRGAGWHVIKVIWGGRWDELLERDTDGAAGRPDELDRRRRVPALRGRVGRLHPRALLRARPTAAAAGREPVRRRPRDAAAWRPRHREGVRRLQVGDRGARPADGHPGQDGEGLGARRRRGQPQRHPPDQEDEPRAAAHAARSARSGRRHHRRRPRQRPPTLRPAGRRLARGAVPGRSPARRSVARCRVAWSRSADRWRRPTRPPSTSCCRDRASSPCRPRPRSPGCCATSPATRSMGDRVVPIVPDEARTFGMDSLVPRGEDLRRAGPEVRARRPPPAAVVRGGARRADPRGGHHRGRRDGVVDRGGDVVRDPRRADAAVLHLLFDVRVPAGRRPHLGRRRRPGARLPARSDRGAHDAPR